MDIFDLFAIYLADTHFQNTMSFIVLISLCVLCVYIGQTDKCMTMTGLGIILIIFFTVIFSLHVKLNTKILSTRDFHLLENSRSFKGWVVDYYPQHIPLLIPLPANK